MLAVDYHHPILNFKLSQVSSTSERMLRPKDGRRLPGKDELAQTHTHTSHLSSNAWAPPRHFFSQLRFYILKQGKKARQPSHTKAAGYACTIHSREIRCFKVLQRKRVHKHFQMVLSSSQPSRYLSGEDHREDKPHRAHCKIFIPKSSIFMLHRQEHSEI